MGIKDFSKVFAGKDIDLKALKHKTVAVDAMNEIYAALKCLPSSALTNSRGESTNHIVISLQIILNLCSYNINQIWVFDNKVAPPEKADELKQRAARRELAALDADKERAMRLTAVVTDKMIEDVQHLLDGLSVPWVEAPIGFDGEQVAAFLTTRHANNRAFAVLTPDPDALLFGASMIIKRIRTPRRKFMSYHLRDVLAEYKLTRLDLIKIGIMLGCDYFKERQKYFNRIGAGTVIKKYKSGKYDDAFDAPDVKRAIDFFIKEVKMDDLKFMNYDSELEMAVPPSKSRIRRLLDWLVSHEFNRDIWTKRINKVISSEDMID